MSRRAELTAALVATLAEDYPPWKMYVLGLLAMWLTAGARVLSSRQSEQQPGEVAAKLSTLHEMQERLWRRVVVLVWDDDGQDERAFVDALFALAQQGRCEEELREAVCDALTVIKLEELDDEETSIVMCSSQRLNRYKARAGRKGVGL